MNSRHLRAQRRYRGIAIAYFEEVNGDLREAVELKMADTSAGLAEATLLNLSIEMAQELMDDLWQCGIRPAAEGNAAGALAATNRHLEDMRKIALAWCLPEIRTVSVGDLSITERRSESDRKRVIPE